MRLYVFKSEKGNNLQAFAGDPGGSSLPKQHGPWTATGIVAPQNPPPYRISRSAVETAIESKGFQLWRMTEKRS